MEENTKLIEISASSASPDPSSSKITAVARVQRNVAEKQRRDKLNGYISELATIVPIVSKAAKRMDKTSILRLSAAYLRICKSPLSGRKKLKSFKWCPSFLNPDQVREILESVDGFLLVAESSGKILFTSRSVERYLGHQDIDMVGHTIHMFIHPEDVEMVKSELNRLLFAFSKEGGNSIPRCSFHCRMKEKNQPRSEVQTYQFVHIMGAMTLIEEEGTSENSRRKASPTFKAFVRVVDADPYNQLSLEEAIADEYITRHSLDGTIIFADHRISTITGHMPHEVTGFNAYKFIHAEDTSVTLFAHHLMFSSEKGSGMIVYRLRTRDDKYVYLKTVGCLQYDSCTSQVDHFVCVNQQLGETEGKSQLKYFIDQYIPHIKGNSTSSLFESVKALQMSSCKTSPSQSENGISVHKNTKASKKMQDVPYKETGNGSANSSILEDSRQSQISSTGIIQGDSLLGNSDPTLVLKTPLLSVKCDKSQVTENSDHNYGKCINQNFDDNYEKCINQNFDDNHEKCINKTLLTGKNVNDANVNDSEQVLNSGAHTKINTQKRFAASNPQDAAHQTLLVASSINGSGVKINSDVIPKHDSIISSKTSGVTSPLLNLRSIQHSNSKNKEIQLENLNIQIETDDNCEKGLSFSNNNLNESLLCEIQNGISDDSLDLFAEISKISENSSQELSYLHSKYICSENTPSSTLDSDNSETVCPLRKDLINLTFQVNSSDSMELCDVVFINNEDFTETLTSYSNLSPLLSSTVLHEDSSSSLPSSHTKWSDICQPQEILLEPLYTEELRAREEDTVEENIKVELW